MATARLVRGANAIPLMIATMCKEAPYVGGVQLVGVVASEKKENPRGSYIIGDTEDLARSWLPGAKGLYWTALAPSHWYVPYVDFDEYSETDCFTEIWRRVGPAITVIGDALQALLQEPQRPAFTMTFNKRMVEFPRPLWKFSFHVHFHELICADISQWKDFLTGLPVARRRVWRAEGEGEPYIEIGAPLYDLGVYGGRSQLFRGPYCGKNGDERAVMRPVRVVDEYDNSDTYFNPVTETSESQVEYVLRCRIAVPPTNAYTKVVFVAPLPERAPSVTLALPVSDAMAFWGPLVETYLLPAWQQHRASLARTISTADGFTVPVTNLSFMRIQEESCPAHVYMYSIVNDTFCEMDAKHCHSGSDRPIRCVIDFVHGTIRQGCRACGANGKKYHFLQGNDITICDYMNLESRATLRPFPTTRYHHFIPYYFSDLFVRTRLCTAAMVYDKRSGIWLDGEEGNALVGELVSQANDKYRDYIRYVENVNMNTRIEAEVAILVQANPPDFQDKLEKIKLKEREEAEKRLAKTGPLLPYSSGQRASFLKDLRNYPCRTEIEDTEPCTHLVPMKNGHCYNVYTAEVRLIKATDYFTSLCNAEITRDAAEIKEIENWFFEIASGQADKALYLKRVAGYLLTMQTHDRKFYVLQGNGKNGKGAFKSFVCSILAGASHSPPRWTSLPPAFWELQRGANAEGPSPVSYGLKDKALLYTDDMPRIPLNTGRLKSVVAHEVTTGRPLYCDPVKFTPKGKVLWTTNPYPNIPGEDNASWERYVLIPCTTKYVESKENPAAWRFKQDRVRMDRILSYVDAFFTVVMTALTHYYQESMAPGSSQPVTLGAIPLPESLLEARKQARHRELPLSRFVDFHLIPTDDESMWTSTADAFDAYLNFLDKENETRQKKQTTLQMFENMLFGAMDYGVVNGVVTGYRLVPVDVRSTRPRYD